MVTWLKFHGCGEMIRQLSSQEVFPFVKAEEFRMNKEHIILADKWVKKNVILKIKGTCPYSLTPHLSSLSSHNCFVIQDLVDTLFLPCGLPALDVHET